MSATLETTAAVPAHDAAPQASATADNVGQQPVRQPTVSTWRDCCDRVDGLHEALPVPTHHVAPPLTAAATLPAIVTTENDTFAVARPSPSTSLKRKATGVDAGPSKHADLNRAVGHGSPDVRHQLLPEHGPANGGGITSPGVLMNRRTSAVEGVAGRVASGDGRGDGDGPQKKAKGTFSRQTDPAPPVEPVPTPGVANGSGITSPPAIVRHPHGIVSSIAVPAVLGATLGAAALDSHPRTLDEAAASTLTVDVASGVAGGGASNTVAAADGVSPTAARTSSTRSASFRVMPRSWMPEGVWWRGVEGVG